MNERKIEKERERWPLKKVHPPPLSQHIAVKENLRTYYNVDMSTAH